MELYLHSPIRLHGVVISKKKKFRDNFTFYLSCNILHYPSNVGNAQGPVPITGYHNMIMVFLSPSPYECRGTVNP